MSNETINTVQPGQTGFAAVIEHDSGTNVSVHTSRPAAIANVAAFAREWWNEVAEFDDVPDEAPEDDMEAIAVYFEAQESEFYSITDFTVET